MISAATKDIFVQVLRSRRIVTNCLTCAS